MPPQGDFKGRVTCGADTRPAAAVNQDAHVWGHGHGEQTGRRTAAYRSPPSHAPCDGTYMCVSQYTFGRTAPGSARGLGPI